MKFSVVMKNTAFMNLLRSRVDKTTGRRMTVKRLAELAGTGRSHLTQVLKNAPGRGHLTRRRLFPHLTPSEVRSLGWMKEYSRWCRSEGILSGQTGTVLIRGREHAVCVTGRLKGNDLVEAQYVIAGRIVTACFSLKDIDFDLPEKTGSTGNNVPMQEVLA